MRRRDLDAAYPAWNDLYARDTVSLEAHAISGRTVQTLLATVPPALVSDPRFDFGVKEADIQLLAEIERFGPGKRAELESLVAELLGRLGSHSRNTVRGVLKAAGR